MTTVMPLRINPYNSLNNLNTRNNANKAVSTPKMSDIPALNSIKKAETEKLSFTSAGKDLVISSDDRLTLEDDTYFGDVRHKNIELSGEEQVLNLTLDPLRSEKSYDKSTLLKDNSKVINLHTKWGRSYANPVVIMTDYSCIENAGNAAIDQLIMSKQSSIGYLNFVNDLAMSDKAEIGIIEEAHEINMNKKAEINTVKEAHKIKMLNKAEIETVKEAHKIKMSNDARINTIEKTNEITMSNDSKVNLIEKCKKAYLEDASHVNEINVDEHIFLKDNASAGTITMKEKSETFRGEQIVNLKGPNVKVGEFIFENNKGVIEIHADEDGNHLDINEIIEKAPKGVQVRFKK